MSTNSVGKSWFESWFDSPYYHLLYSNRDDEEADAFILRLFGVIKAQAGCKVLDLACGAGRHARVMARLGNKVTGLDLSIESIAKAKSLSSGERYEVGDMRSFGLAEHFDCIFNLFTSFGYFENVDDNSAVLQRVFEHLDDDGTFVLDYFNAHKVMANLIPEEEKKMGNVHFSISKELRNGHICKGIKIVDGAEQFQFEERVQLFHFDDFERMLERAGFVIEQVFGSYKLEPLTAGSPRLIIVAKKKTHAPVVD
jgi:SAM-dependent methyltransferase